MILNQSKQILISLCYYEYENKLNPMLCKVTRHIRHSNLVAMLQGAMLPGLRMLVFLMLLFPFVDLYFFI